MDSCPCCNRAFERISDYPLIQVVKFQRLNIPEGIILPDCNYEVYVGPASPCTNKRPPQEVLQFFRANKRAEEFEHGDFTWVKVQGDWDSGNYHRTRKDAKDAIIKQLSPYFDKLEGLVGKEVPTEQALPLFEGITPDFYRILDTDYDLTLCDLGDQFGSLMLKQNKLQIPNLETPQPTRKLAFAITHCNGGSISVVNYLATVGGLAYEGRVKK